MSGRSLFSMAEAVILLDATMKYRTNEMTRPEAVAIASAQLRQMALNKGQMIDETYRNLNGISFQMASMESACEGRTIMKPATRLFIETVKLYREDRVKYFQLLKEAKSMVAKQQTVEESFASWLSDKVSSSQLSQIWPCYHEIEAFCRKIGVLKNALFMTTDLESVKRVQKTVSQNKIFTITHRKRIKNIILAAQYYTAFIKEHTNIEAQEASGYTGDTLTEDTELCATDDLVTNDSVECVTAESSAIPTLQTSNRLPKSNTQKADINSGAAKSEIHIQEEPASGGAIIRENSDLNQERHLEEQYPLLYSRLLAASKVFDDPSGLSLDRICSIINADDKSAVQNILCHVSWATKITAGVYSFSNRIPSVIGQLANDEPYDYSKDRFNEVLMQRYRNGMMFDAIDFDIFRETYEMLFEEKLPFDDSALEVRLRNCGIIYKGRLFPVDGIIDPETKEKLYQYIDSCFASGKSILYYKVIFADLANELVSCYTLADEEMLRAFIEFTAPRGKYYFTEKYLSAEKNVTIDHNAEVANYLLSAGKPMTIDAVASALSHIPQEQVQNIIYSDSRFLRNSKGEFFHEGIFEVSDEELKAIGDLIKREIEDNEYALWPEVWSRIKEKMPSFVENNLYLSWLGVRNALTPLLSSQFTFNASVISTPGKRYEMKDLYQLYAKHHPTFTVGDIEALSKELDAPVALYLWALGGITVRVSYELFVSTYQIAFDVEAVDKAIGSFMSKDYICLREIDSFLTFPNVGYEWNAYLLESYVLSYSKKFRLLNNGRALHNAPGAIVKKDGTYTEFVDVCAALLADSDIELNKNAALNFLASQNMITQKRYKSIELAIQKARLIRARKR